MRHSVLLIWILAVSITVCQHVPASGKGEVVCLDIDGTETTVSQQDVHSRRVPDFFTLIVLPDTQGYADVRHKETQKHWPSIADQRSCFFAQTAWIRKNKQRLNIAMVLHVGDITQTDHDEEWKIADAAFKTLDKHVPYMVCSGNHDMGYSPLHRKTTYSRASRLGVYFPPLRFTRNPLYEPHFGSKKQLHFREEGKIENYYLYLRAGGMRFLIVSLEFKPRDETLAWANRIVAQHSDYRVIVVTHSYLAGRQGQRSTSDSYPVEGNSGESIWKKLVSRHKNVFLVLSGHAMEDLLSSKGRNGNTVHQVQADYWYWDTADLKAGSGYLRIMTFRPAQNAIEVKTYSPVLDTFLTRPTSDFSLDYIMQSKKN